MFEQFERSVENENEVGQSPILFSLAHKDFQTFQDYCGWQRVNVVETIEQQLLEWARIELPAETSGSAACRELIARELASSAATMASYGLWCYFPWRRAVTHLLPPERFLAVRTNRNRDKIEREQQLELAKKRIGVVGLSVGHAAALVLAQERLCGELRLADFDRIDLSNLNRLRTSVLNVGETKTRVASREIAEIDPYLTVRTFPEGITDENIERFLFEGGRLDLIVEECDGFPIKLRVRELARRHGIPVIMDTNDRGLLDVERFDKEPERPIMHGLLGAHTAESVAQLDGPARLELFYSFFGGEERVSAPFRESVRKIGRELVSFPQLASDVHLGGALVAHTAREIFLGRLKGSGRYAIDLHRLIDDKRAELP